jgi:hypothetical protein
MAQVDAKRRDNSGAAIRVAKRGKQKAKRKRKRGRKGPKRKGKQAQDPSGEAGPSDADSNDSQAIEVSDTPWSKDVSPEQRTQAQGLLAEGNRLFVAEKYVQALEKYQRAIEFWDHPTIRFNIARTYVYLGQPLDAFANVEKSLEFGAAPLEQQIYLEAKSYRELLASQVSELRVHCSQTGVRVTLNGADLLSCPGEVKRRVMPGKIQLVAEKPGYLALTREVFVSSGKGEDIGLELIKASDAVSYERRWKAWKPWAVVATGAVMGAGASYLLWKSRSDYAKYDRLFAEACPQGCWGDEIPRSVLKRRDWARRENYIGIGTAIAGGSVLLTGAILATLNLPERVEKRPQSSSTFSPALSATSVGVEMHATF